MNQCASSDRDSLIARRSAAVISGGTKVVRNSYEGALCLIISMLFLISPISESTPVTFMYEAASSGALTSIATCSTRPLPSSFSTTPGLEPLVSSLTGRPNFRISSMKGISPAQSVGSPPLTQTPSRNFARLAISAYIPAIGSVSISPVTSALLWHQGQRKLQPTVKTTAATRPSQSRKEAGR